MFETLYRFLVLQPIAYFYVFLAIRDKKEILLNIHKYFTNNFEYLKQFYPFHSIKNITQNNNNEKDKLIDEQINFKNIPNHVCFIINERLNDVEKVIVSIVHTISSIGIKQLSIYLPKSLYNQLNRETAFSVQETNVRILSSAKVGKNTLAQGLKIIAKKVSEDGMKIDEVNEDLISEAIYEVCALDEPELIISVGRVESLAGFSPWHLKSAEILKLPSIVSVQDPVLIKQLIIKYGNIEKRNGK